MRDRARANPEEVASTFLVPSLENLSLATDRTKTFLNILNDTSFISNDSSAYEQTVQLIITHYLDINRLLDAQRRGFRSTIIIVDCVEFTTSIINSVNDNERVIGVVLYPQRKFDSVSHDRLIGPSPIEIHEEELGHYISSCLRGRRGIMSPSSESASTVNAGRGWHTLTRAIELPMNPRISTFAVCDVPLLDIHKVAQIEVTHRFSLCPVIDLTPTQRRTSASKEAVKALRRRPIAVNARPLSRFLDGLCQTTNSRGCGSA
ncbi:hypothetical protein J6590_060623 [Homalodisca vitripennis]|nr:hypothetical protein J6590_060623 [Homalodisca vitripennis]